MDPFDTLGVDARFRLDLAEAERRHRDISRALHPDRFASASPSERRLSLSRAIDVNEAIRALRDPIRRAEALMRRGGVVLEETSGPKPPPEFLMEMLELREELTMARRAKDLLAVDRLRTSMESRGRAIESALGQSLDVAHGDRQKLIEALPALAELRYVRRFLSDLQAAEEELSP